VPDTDGGTSRLMLLTGVGSWLFAMLLGQRVLEALGIAALAF
jgi:hypothetical protein